MENTFITHIGTDESGKGDFFGPLVIAGVMVDNKSAELFKNLKIRDSKTISDNTILKMSVDIKSNAKFSIISIGNERYNELYKNFGNLNKLLAWGHAKVIENILENNTCEYALSDKFGDDSLILNALQKRGRTIRLEQMTKAESDIAVAAASVLARATFVQKMNQMKLTYECEFPKGCNSIVKDIAKKFINLHGKDKLNEVCKMHFKTYKEVLSK